MIRAIVKRNMMLFFKDKSAVFFSFMAVFVVLGLYIAFLGDMMIQPLKLDFPDTAREISDTWIIAGTMGIVSLTTSLSVLGIIIEDKSKHILNDFYTTPIPSIYITFAYILSTIAITMMVSIITLFLGEWYIVAYGGHFISFLSFVKVLGCSLLSITASSIMLYFFMSFFKSATSFSNVTTIIGTLSGFLMGIYVPVGALPSFLQTIISYFPPSHSAALFRNLMMEDVLRKTFSTLPDTALPAFQKQFGLTFSYGSYTSTLFFHILLLLTMGMVFLLLVMYRQKHQK